MLAREQKYYTPEEYLALEEAAEYRSEYYQGEIFAMSGSSANHNRIARNLVIALESAFENKPCESFINDMRLLVKKNGLYTYPNVMVVCGQIKFVEGRTDTVTNPVVVIEILSESTQDYDRGSKFMLYRGLETLQEYILIDQTKIYVEQFRRLEDGRWILDNLDQTDDLLRIESIDFKISLQQIYRNVDWEEVQTSTSKPS